SLAEDAGLDDLPPRVRILVLRREQADPQSPEPPHRHAPPDDVAALLRAASALPRADGVPALAGNLEASLLRHETDDVVYLVLTEDQMAESAGPRAGSSVPSPALGSAGSGDSASGLSAAVSEPVPLSA